ncbi:hypothetical protein RB195_007977 [Necator americanus]|uniref:Cytochrome b5 heme-binding domain-containing protein n=1 Tax=Necator americanus TaxID=51031 RepID=A0ABR1C0Z6_NECAM
MRSNPRPNHHCFRSLIRVKKKLFADHLNEGVAALALDRQPLGSVYQLVLLNTSFGGRLCGCSALSVFHKMSDNLKEISLSEVEKHSTVESCWIVMEGKVYDVSKFLNEHPGGAEVIAELAGKDATASFEDVGHSKDAREMAKEYLIGKVQATTDCIFH